MKVCMIVEGAYPYVAGGVSSWIQQFITQFKDVEFAIHTLVVSREQEREFKYKIPDNVSEIKEIYLLGDDYIKKNTKFRLNRKEHKVLERLLFGDKVSWDEVFLYFQKPNMSINDLLGSEEFLKMAKSYYESKHDNIVFIDYLWTIRSMYLPLFQVLNSKPIKADIYHSLSTGYAGVFGAACKAITDKPLIISEHGIYTREREEEIIKSNWVQGIYKDLWIQQFYKCSSACYDNANVVTSLFKEANEFQIELGCDESRTRIIPNGIDISKFENLPQKNKNSLDINVGAILRVTPIKDVMTIINGFHIAKQENDNLKLFIMGPLDENPEYATECQNLVASLGTRDVEFTGNININDYIGKMDMMLLSSISEGQPFVILEGFAAKKPVISTNVGNCYGLIHGENDSFGDAGIVIPIMNSNKLAKAILDLAKDSDMRNKMGSNGYNRVTNHYRAEDVFKQYGELYSDLFNGSGE